MLHLKAQENSESVKLNTIKDSKWKNITKICRVKNATEEENDTENKKNIL